MFGFVVRTKFDGYIEVIFDKCFVMILVINHDNRFDFRTVAIIIFHSNLTVNQQNCANNKLAIQNISLSTMINIRKYILKEHCWMVCWWIENGHRL